MQNRFLLQQSVVFFVIAAVMNGALDLIYNSVKYLHNIKTKK